MQWSDKAGGGTLTDTTVVSNLTATTSSRQVPGSVRRRLHQLDRDETVSRQQRREAVCSGVGLNVQMKTDVHSTVDQQTLRRKTTMPRRSLVCK